MIENRVNEEDYTAMDIAAAFLKMAMRDGTDVDSAMGEDEFGDTGAEEGMVRLFHQCGTPAESPAGRHSWARSPERPAFPDG